MVSDPRFWQLVLGLALLCMLSGVVGLRRPDNEPVLMDWALVLAGFGFVLLAASRLAAWLAPVASLLAVLALLFEVVALACFIRSRFWRHDEPKD